MYQQCFILYWFWQITCFHPEQKVVIQSVFLFKFCVTVNSLVVRCFTS